VTAGSPYSRACTAHPLAAIGVALTTSGAALFLPFFLVEMAGS
jgi:hypothetical protein